MKRVRQYKTDADFIPEFINFMCKWERYTFANNIDNMEPCDIEDMEMGNSKVVCGILRIITDALTDEHLTFTESQLRETIYEMFDAVYNVYNGMLHTKLFGGRKDE